MPLRSLFQTGNHLFLLLFLANGFSNFVQFVSSLLLARTLGPEQFGVFSFFVTVAQSLSLFIDLGLCATMVRLASGKSDHSNRQQMVYVTAGVQAFIYLLALAVLIPAASRLLTLFEQQGQFALYYLAIGMAGAIVVQWLIKSVLEVYQSILLLAGFTALYAVLRSLLFALAYVLVEQDLRAYFLALYLLPLIATCLIYAAILIVRYRRRILGGTMTTPSGPADSVMRSASELFHYGKWMLSQPIYSMLYLIPIFTLSRSSAFELGIYSAAFTFSAIFPLINTSIRQITMPMVSRFTSREELEAYLLQVRRKTPLAIVVAAAIILTMGGILLFVLDDRYNSAFGVFCLLGSAMAGTILLGQYNIVSHVFRRPDLLMVMTIAEALVLLLVCPIAVYWLELGALGGAAAVSMALIGGEIWLYLQLRKLRRDLSVAIHTEPNTSS